MPLTFSLRCDAPAGLSATFVLCELHGDLIEESAYARHLAAEGRHSTIKCVVYPRCPGSPTPHVSYSRSMDTSSGRPNLSGGYNTRSPQLTFRAPQKLYDRATALAKQEGITLPTLMRAALDAYVYGRLTLRAPLPDYELVRGQSARLPEDREKNRGAGASAESGV